jgi:hypothetical protein
MRILIACEFSGTVRDAFLKKGHEAVSCDIIDSDVDGPHIKDDVLNHLNEGWDMMIAHPPCTYLANSGVQHMYVGRKKENGICPTRFKEMMEAKEFFIKLLNSNIDKICIENPVPHNFSKLPKYSQIVQPYFFGEEAQKKTCLWLKGLPLLEPTKIVGKGEKYITGKGKSNGSKWYQVPPGPDRWKIRSKTFQSIASAMAEQWG